ncbi:hypothetical protein TBR22_A15800 [Luteitalea sp. TBR-22]|uniref:protein kinase domain-containing protein n=1 Tax=Luteitalea sp. TBR-22 TaxID=2802971 RepID=UPI001AF2932D|nr:protein kinase [Luteitalea sp. TBR-22]BCS32370.1 hypothetical protein TBR22_A15800 [Luteitalea sp. TBR-22]
MIGTRLGPYQVVAKLGEGGMGEVYRATDTNLKRQVAIKVLPAAVAADGDRLARFQREAEVLAALNHPNIAAIYGLEKTPECTALVMELVEGEDLSQRIDRLRARGASAGQAAMPLDEALPIARQIAEALEAAHEQGIVHRDLKPANIKVREDGTVKVLDFGLAKALGPEGPSATAGGVSASMSPTMTSPAMTAMGMILGTAAYMAPEQARGRAVDRRADIWAFGVVVFEMLAGQRAFPGDDLTDTLAAVVKLEPAWESLPPGVPDRVRRVLHACLRKDPRQRLGDMQSVRLALDGAFETTVSQAAASAPSALAQRSLVARALPWAIASVAVLIAGVLLMFWAPWRPAPVPTPRKVLASIGADASLPTSPGASAILSPDGTTLAFVARQAGSARLFIRTLDQLQAVPLAGTEGAEDPFFSPDGQWLAFFADGALKKISVAGGAAVTICDAVEHFGGTWTDSDTIVFNRSGAPTARLMRVSAAGGKPEIFGVLSPGAGRQRWPQALPGGQAVLYSEHSPFATNWDTANLVVAPVSGGAPKVVVRGGYFGRYVPSGPGSPKRGEREGGHLIYLHQGTVFAVPFDPTRLETVGPAMPALEGVATFPNPGGGKLAVSSEGTLVYVPGTAVSGERPIEWLTRDGKAAVLRATKAQWSNPRFSPNGEKLALDISDGQQRDIWVYDWARDTLTQLTFEPGEDRFPVWTPDGRRLVFGSDRAKAGTFNLYWANADGTGEVTRLTDSPETHSQGSSWHPSGKFLAFQAARGAGNGVDLMILPMEGDATRGWTPGTPTVFLGSPANETTPTFSPDGRWIAYTSSERGGVGDIYVRPFPGPGGPWRVSTGGGRFPRWSATAPELLFVAREGTITAARYAVVGDSFRADTPQVWTPTSIQAVAPGNSGYALHPDGKRVAAAAVADDSEGVANDKVVFFFNFGAYLKRIAPGGQTGVPES